MNIMSAHTKYQQGFTLFDVLLYVSISGIILLSITVFALTMLGLRQKNTILNEVHTQASFALAYLTDQIESMDTVSTPEAGSSGSALITGKDAQVFEFGLDGGALYTTIDDGEEQYLTSDEVVVSDLSFAYTTLENTLGLVRIAFTVSSLDGSSVSRSEFSYSAPYVTTVLLRGY